MAKYQESEDHVPNPLDVRGTFQTTRTGVPQNHEALSEVFAADRAATAQRIVDTLDGKANAQIVYAEDEDREDQEARLREAAEAELEHEHEAGGQNTDAQQIAAKSVEKKSTRRKTSGK